MRKITFLTLLLTCTFLYPHGNNAGLENDIEVVEILDESLEEINYYQTEFEKPTKLVFSNLNVVGKVFFAETFNLVEIEFPKLETVNGSFTIAENFDLERISAMELGFIDENLSVLENSLKQFDTYKLKRIGGVLSFRENHNLLRIEFPILEEIVGPLLLQYNSVLEEIKFHKLLIINDLLLVQGHHELRVLEICNLFRIIQTGNQEPAILIANESKYLDDEDYCFHLESQEDIEILDSEEQHEEDITPISDNDHENPETEETPVVEDEPTRVALYPNPTRGVFRIDSEIEFYKIEIYEATGNLVTTFRSLQVEYDISLLPAGLYYVVAHHTDRVHATVKKLMVL